MSEASASTPPLGGASLVVASNRGPVSFTVDPGGLVVTTPAAGGLAPSLSSALAGTGATWIAAAMSPGDREVARTGRRDVGGITIQLLDRPEEEFAGAYRVVANATLWFLHHGLFDRSRRPLFDRTWKRAWQSYISYNRAFAAAIAEAAAPGATVVVHDYHLCLVGRHLARLRPDLATVYFTHTPFCTPEELRVLPREVAAEVVGAMSEFGACGFHTARWAAAFAACATSLGVEPPPCFVSPLGPDPVALEESAAGEACRERRHALEEMLDGRMLLLRSDRVELSKNVLRGFLAFEELLVQAPQWRGRVVFQALVYPSREELPEYLAYRSEVEHAALRLNERFATPGYTPVVLAVRDDHLASLAALSRSDVLLVNPLRDGMNLVAKEGPILNRHDGVLVLSREAGAIVELSSYALEVNPFDVSETAARLDEALTMPAAERRRRAEGLSEVSRGRPPVVWHEEVLAAARRSRSAQSAR